MSRYFVLTVSLPVILSCAGVGYNTIKLDQLHRAIAAEDKRVSIYDRLQSRAFFRVIYKSRDLRYAYCEAIAEMESLSTIDKDALCKREAEEEERYLDFLVILSTTESRVNDLDTKNSVWRIFLENSDGGRVYPLEIKEIKADPRQKILIPGLSRFGRLYRLRFEKGTITDVRGMSLIFSGVIGKAVFKY